MRRVIVLGMLLCLSLSPLAVPNAQAAISKPSAPAITSISFSAPKNGKVTITVSISLPTRNGGSKITGSKVSASGRTCTMQGMKTSCIIKNVKQGKSVVVKASSKNRKGYGANSESIRLVVGKSQYSLPTPTPTPTAIATCATGSSCVVGDTGPGGGIIFYVDELGFNCGPAHTDTGSPLGGLCKYLEFAPSGWLGGSDEQGDTARSPRWVPYAYADTDVVGIDNLVFGGAQLNTDSELGLGYKNSIAIVNQSGTYETYNQYAAGAARTYKGGLKEDWYLPTSTEINLLCQWVRGVTPSVGASCSGGFLNYRTQLNAGFGGSDYWTSTECQSNFAWAMNFDTQSYQNRNKSSQAFVRPVRAF